jgi:putative transport protein
MEWLGGFLERYPELALYLAIGLGYLIGSLKIKGFSLGPVTGSLFAGILLGQLSEIPVSSVAKSILFLLFLFGIGYSVGPQFLRTLKTDGLRPIGLALCVTVTGLLAAWAVASILGLDPGFAAGLTSGALTESPAMGTATEAINSLPLPAEERSRLIGHIAVADALCYVFGAFGVIWFCSALGPKLLHIDLEEEASKLEAELGIERKKLGVISAWRPFELRAYQIREGGSAVGKTVAEAEALVPNARLFIQRIRRGEQILEAQPSEVLYAGDVVAVAGRREVLVEVLGTTGSEVEDHELLDVPVASFDVFLTSKELAGKTVGEIARSDAVRSLFLRQITRGGQVIPIARGTELQRGDVLRVVGPEPVVERAAKLIGPIVRPTEATDFVTLGFAIFLGGVVGVLVAFPVGNMHISLSTSVGVLLAGLMVGHLRSTHPLFGRIPDGAVSLMTSLGLAAFVAMTGLHAGPIFVEAVREAGIGLLIGGVFVTLIPQFAGLYFARYVLKMNPLLILGGLAGAQTMTAGLAAVQERSGSPVAVLGYTGTVAIGHILLTTWGAVIVALTA